MYLSQLNIKGYKIFKSEFSIKFIDGLTVLVGENASGKTAVIDAIRLLLNEDEYGRQGISSSDFHRPITESAKNKGADSIELKGIFRKLSDGEQIAYLPWLIADNNETAYLNLKIDNKENARGRYNRVMWGGESISGIYEAELMNAIACIYLPPLRDASNKLEANRGSRLSRLFRKYKPKRGEQEPNELEKKFSDFNKELLEQKTIKSVNKAIKKYLLESLGSVLGQDAMIQFSEANFDRIVERLRLLFYPEIQSNTESDKFREISENSLGYNNILYLATVLAELESLDTSHTLFKILLIEEPEAHLHPQLQIRLLKYLQQQAKESNIQIIVTTHSATVTASSDLYSLNILTIQKGHNPKTTLLSDCGLCDEGKFFLERWLDITKATLFFAKGLLLVEGISEALVIKELVKKTISKNAKTGSNIPQSLEDYGVSIINLNGIYFKHFMQLFKGYTLTMEDNGIKKREMKDFIPIKCAGLTDCDPMPKGSSKPTNSNLCECKNREYYLVDELKDNVRCRLYSNLKTFEYDFGITDPKNIKLMCEIYCEIIKTDGDNRKTATGYKIKDWSLAKDEEKAEASLWLLNHIDDSEVGKGYFNQMLAKKISDNTVDYEVPQYIENAILWVTNIQKPAKK